MVQPERTPQAATVSRRLPRSRAAGEALQAAGGGGGGGGLSPNLPPPAGAQDAWQLVLCSRPGSPRLGTPGSRAPPPPPRGRGNPAAPGLRAAPRGWAVPAPPRSPLRVGATPTLCTRSPLRVGAPPGTRPLAQARTWPAAQDALLSLPRTPTPTPPAPPRPGILFLGSFPSTTRREPGGPALGQGSLWVWVSLSPLSLSEEFIIKDPSLARTETLCSLGRG